MGYSFFKITSLQKPFRDKLATFVNTLGSAIRDGKTISFADNDIGHVLQLQNERLKKKGLVMDYEVYDRDKNRQQVALFKDTLYLHIQRFEFIRISDIHKTDKGRNIRPSVDGVGRSKGTLRGSA